MTLNPDEMANAIAALKRALKIVRSLPVTTPCASCDWFSSSGYCDHWKADVPAEAQAAGCAEWCRVPF